MTADELAQMIDARLVGDGDVELTACAGLVEAQADQVSFLTHRSYRSALAGTDAGAVIVGPEDAAGLDGRTLLVADDPYFAFRQAMVKLHGFQEQPEVGISPRAVVDDTAELGELCSVRPGVYVAPRAIIGDRVILYPGVYVGKDAVVGNDCILYPNVVIYAQCRIGDRAILHASTSIGQDGFGYATAQRPGDHEVRHHKIPQAGLALVEDDVEMGAGCSVDRATVGATVIGKGTKFSNNVTIGHGARIGQHNLFVGGVGIAGSTVTGDYVALGGQVGVAGHLRLGDHVKVAASSKVMRDIPAGQEWGGTPARPFADTKRAVLLEKRLPGMAAKLKALARQVEALENKLNARFGE